MSNIFVFFEKMNELYMQDVTMEPRKLAGTKTPFLIALVVVFLLPIAAITQEMVDSPVPDAEVSRAQFTTRITNREPVDQVVKVDNSIPTLYYFTELRHLQGRKVFHRWEHNGRVVSEVPFMVEGPRWRVFSKKALNPSMSGKWTVFVIDQSGWPIHASIFEYENTPPR